MEDKSSIARKFVNGKIRGFCESKNESMVRAIMAKLRRGIGKDPGSMPELWEVTLNGLFYTGKEDNEPTYLELSVHSALTLFALHQQGKDIRSHCMNRDGEGLGKSVRRLVKSNEDLERVKSRFDKAITSDSLTELSNHLRGLIQILKASDIPLDYPDLASDIYKYQFPDVRDSVRLKWGREFYSFNRKEKDDNE